MLTNLLARIMGARGSVTQFSAWRPMAACGGLLLGHFFGARAGFRMNLRKLHEPRPVEENFGETIKDLPTFAKPMEKEGRGPRPQAM